MQALIDQEFRGIKKWLDFKLLNQDVNISFSTPKAMIAEKVIGVDKLSQPKEPTF